MSISFINLVILFPEMFEIKNRVLFAFFQNVLTDCKKKLFLGQIISKCLFGVFNFLQKMNKNTLHTSKNELIHSFFGRIHVLTICSRNWLTFSDLKRLFSITRTLYWKSEKIVHFWNIMLFLTYFWKFLRSNKLYQLEILEFKLGKIIGI